MQDPLERAQGARELPRGNPWPDTLRYRGQSARPRREIRWDRGIFRPEPKWLGAFFHFLHILFLSPLEPMTPTEQNTGKFVISKS